jgi:hypothetical protein
VELDSGAQISRSDPQRISFARSPHSPFDDDGKSLGEKFLTKFPLQRLDSGAFFFIPQIQRKGIYPLVGGKTNCAKPAFERSGERGLTRSWQAAHND